MNEARRAVCLDVLDLHRGSVTRDWPSSANFVAEPCHLIGLLLGTLN